MALTHVKVLAQVALMLATVLALVHLHVKEPEVTVMKYFVVEEVFLLVMVHVSDQVSVMKLVGLLYHWILRTIAVW